MSALSDLRLPLNRPQYVPSPEVLVSSLVHRTFESAEIRASGRGLRFLEITPSPAAITTGPSTPAEFADFGHNLELAGLRTDLTNACELAEAVVGGVKGVRPSRSKAIPVSPLTPRLALAQDLRGVLGAPNPPNMGAVLETMYRLGSPKADAPTKQMGELWVDAAFHRMSLDHSLQALDSAFNMQPRISSFVRVDPPSVAGLDGWSGRYPHSSPFSWLHRHWNKLMERTWVEALPARIWTDWSTMLLRTSLGFGYLWESRWYGLLGATLLGNEPVTRLPLPSEDALLPWPPSRLPTSTRNVKTEIQQMVSRGLEIQSILTEELAQAVEPDSLTALEALRTHPNTRKRIREAMGGRLENLRLKNTRETIIYALQQRSADVLSTDYYGLLRPRGTRYSVVAPGAEWIAVVASLACPEPGGETHVGEVMRSLEELGLRPELQEVVQLLESAGLAEDSADADHGVRVRSAF